jgi:hypothetical protein
MAYNEEGQDIPIAGFAENLDQIKRFDGPPAEFWPAFLEWSTRVTGASTGLLLVKGPDGGSWKNLIVWPSEDNGFFQSTEIKSLIQEIAEKSAHKGYAWLNADAADGTRGTGALLGARLKLEEEERISVVVLRLNNDSGLSTEEAAMRLLLVIDTPMVYQLARLVRQAKLDVSNFSEALDLMVLLNDQKRYIGAAMTFCSELAARFTWSASKRKWRRFRTSRPPWRRPLTRTRKSYGRVRRTLILWPGTTKRSPESRACPT